LLIVLVALSIFLDWFPQIQNNSLIVAGGILATAIELYGFGKDRKSREEAKPGSSANLTSSGPVRILQKDVSVQGQQTNFADKVQGNVFSGRFDGPVAVAGGDALDIRDSAGSINKPNGPVSQHFGDIIIHESEKLPIPRIHPHSSDFVGREEELKELIANFDRGATITGLRGMGGIGKTELALALAVKLKDHFPDGQLFLNMLGTSKSPLKPEDAMAHVIRSYRGVDAPLPEDINGLSGLYHSVLFGKKALILLDNAACREQVEPLLPPVGSALLITSRNKFALAGLKKKDLNVLPLKDAKKLLLEIAGRIGEHAGELAKLCGCLPIALRNAAYALKEMPNIGVDDYMKRLGEASKRLELVEASFSSSYDLLTPKLQRLWSLLSIFPSDFDLAGAAAVWEMEGIPAEDALGELVKWSLVNYLPSAIGEGGRYRLHDLARDFAGLHLDATVIETARLRHAEHYRNVLSVADEHFEKGKEGTQIGLRLFDQDKANILAGQFWAEKNLEGNFSAAVELCKLYPNAGVYVLDLRLSPRQKIQWLNAGLQASRQSKDNVLECAHLGNLGNAYSHLGEMRKGIEYYEQALIISREIGDRMSEGINLGNLGNAYSDLGETRKAIEYCEQALIISREIGDRRGEGNHLGNLGNAYFDLGETQKAIECHRLALENSREIGDKRGEGADLGNLGNAYFDLGETRKAIGYYDQALKISREIGDRSSEGNHLFNISLYLEKLGQKDKAIDLAKSALAIYEQMESPQAETVRKAMAAWEN
jgi:tetratricopeptide (TPR) repeat protein